MEEDDHKPVREARWEQGTPTRSGMESPPRRSLPRTRRFGIETCARTWGQCEPYMEVEKEAQGDPSYPAVFSIGVYSG